MKKYEVMFMMGDQWRIHYVDADNCSYDKHQVQFFKNETGMLINLVARYCNVVYVRDVTVKKENDGENK